MKAKAAVALILTAALGLGVLAGCNSIGTEKGLTDKALTGDYVADFANGDPGEKVLFASDGWSNGSVFNTVWTADNLTFSNGEMHLGITEAERKAFVDGAEKTFQYTSGEARTTYYYGYGDYEVRMKPTSSGGTASTFFVCTGDYDEWPDGTKNPWDEIDIEFLGKDTTQVQFNYFANGVGGHEHMYKLGFDASKEFHNYGFRWAEDYITWFVDGNPVYRVDKANVKAGETFPKTAGRILMNYWCGNKDAEGWMGKFSGPDSKTADYQWVKTSAAKVDPPTGDPYPDTPTPPPATGDTTDWSKVAAQELGFTDSEPFTVALSADKLSADITYTDAKGASYTNVEMPAPAAAANTDLVHFKVKNNGEADVYLRISLINNEKDAENAASGYTKSSDVNVSATMNGVTAETNTVNGGSYFTIPAGEEVECVIKFDGVVDRIQLMPDTSKYNDTATHAGNLHVSELKFTKSGEETPSTPSLPEADNKGVTVNETKLEVKGNTEDYVVISDETANTLRVVYADLAGATYKNLWMDATAIARTKNVFSVKVTNHGSAKLTFRIDIESATVHGTNNIVACNLSAKQDGAEVWTDLDWGGAKFEIDAGATTVCAVTYDTAMGPTNVKLYFDSCINEDTAKHSGDVTLAEMAFSGTGTYTPPTPTTPTGDPVALTFTAEANSGYTVTAGEDGKSATLAYVGLGNTYKPVTAACAELAAGKNTFTIKIRNNKATSVTVRVDVQGTTWVSTSTTNEGQGTDASNQSATCTGGSGPYTDKDWGGTKITLAANEEVTLTITYDETAAQGAVKNILIFVDSMGGDTNSHDASVTVSGFLFTKED